MLLWITWFKNDLHGSMYLCFVFLINCLSSFCQCYQLMISSCELLIYLCHQAVYLRLTTFFTLVVSCLFKIIVPIIFPRHLLRGRLSLCQQHVAMQSLLILWCQIQDKMWIQVCFFQHDKPTPVYPFPFLVWLVKAVPEIIKIVVCHQCFLWVSRQCSQLDLRVPCCLQPAGIALWCAIKKRRKHASKFRLWQY